MAEIFALVLPFFGLIVLGYGAGKIVRQPVEALGWMNIFIIYIALPALFFQLLSKTPIEKLTEWSYIVGSSASTYIIFGFMFAVSLWHYRAIPRATITGLAAAYGNIGYMGPGLALLAFGASAAVPVALIFAFENALHFAIVPALMALSGTVDRSPGALAFDVVKRILLHPFILATIVGVGAAALEATPPLAVERLLDYLANAAAPCALFVMGVTLALRPLRRVPVELSLIVPLKLVVHPLLCWVVLSAMGNFDPVWIQSAILLAALPTATNVFVLAQQYNVWAERASASVLVTTAASVVTVTAILWLMRTGSVPVDLFP
ncbi:AEC family transporter [Notoacmeibacter marinus]|uniref:AEC family transporter n=1 Tax=Notoacmeibacter marinus TaxID=1876515 RepID=UPI000DF120AC|nr:AEC family transporter [Notoacmeibacter marinus]